MDAIPDKSDLMTVLDGKGDVKKWSKLFEKCLLKDAENVGLVYGFIILLILPF